MVLEECRSDTDARLVQRVLAGELDVYELLMRRYNQRLFRIIRSVVTDDLEAEDILQETWVRVFEHLNQFAGRSSFPTWVSRIAVYEALARSRKSKRWVDLEDQQGEIMAEANRRHSSPETPETDAIRSELSHMLQTAIDALPPVYRLVFVLREVEQLNTMETAECLGVSEEAVKTRLHRSRAMLRRTLEGRIGAGITEAYSFMGLRCDRTVSKVLVRIGARTE